MKRFDVSDPYEMVESPDGEFVKWEDVKGHIAEAQRVYALRDRVAKRLGLTAKERMLLDVLGKKWS